MDTFLWHVAPDVHATTRKSAKADRTGTARQMLYLQTMKALLMAATVMALSGGVASANRFVGGHVGGGHVSVHESFHGGYHGGGFVGHGPIVRGGGYYGRGGWGYSNRIYMGRPFIGARYYDYHFRPGLIVEDYPVRDGYVWVRGSWAWNGGEWIWSPGYYEPVGY
jgi:WXXGXW repeat (2 copies)